MPRFLGVLALSFLPVTALADSAQLEIIASMQNPMRVTMAIVNRGPDTARNNILTIDVPPGLTVTNVVNTKGECDLAQRPIRCAIPDIEYPGQYFPAHYMGVELSAPFVDATWTVGFSVSSETPDPSLTNNTTSVTFETKVEADLSVFLDSAPDSERIDPGQVAELWAFVSNGVRNNKPTTNVRIEFAATNGAIEKIEGFETLDATCTIDGSRAVCTAPLVPFDDAVDMRVFVRASNDRLAGATSLSMHASSEVPERDSANDRDEHTTPVYRWIAVTSTADSGPGSLRQAIDYANANCTPGPCRIVFEIPAPVPAEGWFTITPLTELPAITAHRVSVEGARQTAFTGDTNPGGPEIAIDGRVARRGLKILSECEAAVEGLALGNFDEDQGLWFSGGANCPDGYRPDRRAVEKNHIGVDPTGTTPWPNRRGIRADGAAGIVRDNVIRHNRFSGIWMWSGPFLGVYRNRIESNGSSGVFLGPHATRAIVYENTIANHREMGAALARGTSRVEIRQNRMSNNGGLGIDWGLDGVSPVDSTDIDTSNAPVLLSAIYDAANDETDVTMSIKSVKLGLYGNVALIDFYTNATPDGDGEQPYTWIYGDVEADGTITVSVPGDLRGKWINATWTRVTDWEYYAPAVTSELSNAIFVSE